MDEDQQPEEEKSPFMQENEVLTYFQDNFTTNRKKLIKMATALHPKVSPFIRRGLIFSILNAPDPVKYLLSAFADMDQYNIVIKDLIEAGNHGMIITKANVIYPVNIKAWPHWLVEDKKWNLDEEIEIQHQLIKNFIVEQQVPYFHGKIVLFPKFGFSGMPREIEARA